MSISTSAISSDCFCPCNSETRLKGDLDGWRKDLRRRFIPCRDSGVEFLRKYVPCRLPCPPSGDVTSAFAKFAAHWELGKDEKADSDSYLLEGLDALVSSFPAKKRPSFTDCARHTERFPREPFSVFAPKHHSTHLDIAMSFPGQTFNGGKSLDWLAFSSAIQANLENKADPFKRCHRKHCKALVQLTVNAHNLMHANGLTCAFVLSIYGDIVRICRFDHSGVVVCPPLGLKNLEDINIIQQFFWNFVHPVEDVPFVGWDPTVRWLDKHDEEWLLTRLEFTKVDTTDFVLREARSVQVPDGESEGGREPHTCIAFRLLDINTRLFSRATTVWHGIRDTRRLVNGRLIDPNPSTDDLRVRIIKEAWRPLSRRPEKVFYNRLDNTVAPHERKGLPTLVRGSDLGEREVRLWESTLYGAHTPVTPDGAHHRTRLSVPASQRVSTPIPSTLSTSTSPSNEPVHRPMQQTFTWRQARGAKYWHRERSHVRFVVREVGRPVTQFRNTKELVITGCISR